MDGHDGAELGAGNGGGHDYGHSLDLGTGHSYGDQDGYDFGLGDYSDGHYGGYLALMDAYSHCQHSHDLHSENHDNSGLFGHDLDIGHLGGWSHGEAQALEGRNALSKRLEAIAKAKADPTRRFWGAHVIGHGYIDTIAQFKVIAAKQNMFRFCHRVPNFNPLEWTQTGISNWNPFSPVTSNRQEPAGSYPGAGGLTSVFRQYWQVANKTHWWMPQRTPAYDRTKNTYIEISIIQWYFAEIDDYETRVDLVVVPIPVYDRIEGCYGYRRAPLVEHQNAAAAITAGLFRVLKQTEPTASAKARRARVQQYL